MQYDEFVSSLNDKQLEAVETASQHVRIVAGAGSGKTRVLTYRISYLISQLNVKPWKILAITFTNKVANEMKNRVINIVPEANKDLTIKTFHSFAAMFLRREINSIGFPQNFTILDEEDQLKLLKDIAAEFDYKKSDPIVKTALNYIGNKKMNEQYPDDIKIHHESFDGEKICLEFYQRYEEIKQSQFALDFDDLLLKTNQILTSFPDIRMKWQDKYDHILIDEFQDTNNSEYKLISLLLRNNSCLYVVGDPDQTIYTWRGANQDIIIKLDNAFYDLETIILNENYRSTQSILDSANKLIKNNRDRVPKDLFTNNGKGDAIIVRSLDSGAAEANYVAREILNLTGVKHYKLSDIAILYRSNYITLEFEKALTAKSIPYVIYGSLKFYQRAEIKDVLAYFRLVNNTKDDISFERIINVPKRKIGDTSVQAIKYHAELNKQSIFDFIKSQEAEKVIPSRVIFSLKSLVTRIEIAQNNLKENDEIYSKILEDLIIDIGYYDHLKNLEDGDDRVENVKSLFDDLRHYLKENPESSFDEYLQNIALVSAQDDMKDGEHVTMMTAHTAKGLEFPVVFVVKLNQGVFPNNRALFENGFKAMEEERRLAYVAMTRAKERLYLTLSSGYSYVTKGELSASQFLEESGNPIAKNKDPYFSRKFTNDRGFSPQITVEDARKAKGFNFDDEPVRQDFSQITNDVSHWDIGDVVIHKKLGRGVVVSVEDESIIKVDFDEHGLKTILGNHPMVSKGAK